MRLDQLLNHARDNGTPFTAILDRAEASGIPRNQLPDVASLYAKARKPGLTKQIENHTVVAIAKGLGVDMRTVWLAVGDSIFGEGVMFRGPENEKIVQLPAGWYDLDAERFGLWHELGSVLVRDQRNAGSASDLRAARARIAGLEVASKPKDRPPAATRPTFQTGRTDDHR